MEFQSQQSPEDQKQQYILFVSGMSVKSTHAIENFKKICDTYMKDSFELQIIDIARDQQAAITYQIVAIPTLMRIVPAPVRTLLGDLSDENKVLKILDLI